MAEPIEAAVDEFHVGLLRIDIPETRNALSPAAMERIGAELRRLDADPAARCLVLAGSEAVFATGGDVGAIAAGALESALHRPAAEFWQAVGEVRTPIVAAVSGFALGSGCELALACDIVVADDKARFGQPEVTLGLIPGGGATQRLARAAGKQVAMELILTGRLFDAEMGREWGLVNRVVKKRAWLQEALELARTVAARSPSATRLAKQAVLAAEEAGLREGLRRERALFEEAMATEDRVEAMQALVEKREPRFESR